MKQFYLLIFSCFLFFSCKKAVENVAEDAIVKIMVTGQWRVTKYTKGATDVTTDFSLYSFQFKENRTVDAIKSSAVERTGNWEGNASDLSAPTIYSNFTGASYPLTLLNGTFIVTKTGQTFVEAKMTVGRRRTFYSPG
jgi:hypothetical protein